jgi:cytochrome P450
MADGPDALTLECYSPFDPEVMACPHASWAMLQREAPIYRVNMPDAPHPVYLATRREEIDFIAKRTDLFSNAPLPTVWRWGEFEPALQEIFDRTGQKVVYTVQTTDPPESQMYRKVLTDALGPGRVKEWRPEIEAIIQRLLAAIPSDEEVNFVEAFSVPLTLQVICLILGIPYDEADYYRFYSDEFTHLVDPAHPIERAKVAMETVVEGYGKLREKLEGYQACPARNLMSAIANATYQDGRLTTMDEALSMVHTSVIAGNETTRNALSSAMFTLARDPALWTRLREDRTKIAAFIEEVLRRDGPAVTTPRTVLEDVELGGVHIPKGSCIFVMWAAGSLDERIFPDPMTFDLDRKNKSAHSTFGLGIHHCAGSALARAELSQAVDSWLTTFESVELTVPAEDVHYDPVFGFHSLSNLPVRFTRPAA